jgi:CRISPR/Cas system CSM-associated protein Csm3 (group 7 of RAMP superfamily)
LKWLETDYLGGHGSRGSGKIAFKDLKVTKVIGELSDNSKIEECNRILNTGA